MIQHTAPFIALLVLGGFVSGQEAEILQKQLSTKEIPKDWYGIIKQIESIIKRPLEKII